MPCTTIETAIVVTACAVTSCALAGGGRAAARTSTPFVWTARARSRHHLGPGGGTAKQARAASIKTIVTSGDPPLLPPRPPSPFLQVRGGRREGRGWNN